MQQIEEGTKYVGKKITNNLSTSLSASYTLDEVEIALKQLPPLKSPGPDSFNPNFYQTYWHIMGDEVTSVILKFLNECIFDSGINFTFIVLIPKIKNPTKAYDFRLINLCNVIYELVFKVLANRLK